MLIDEECIKINKVATQETIIRSEGEYTYSYVRSHIHLHQIYGRIKGNANFKIRNWLAGVLKIGKTDI